MADHELPDLEPEGQELETHDDLGDAAALEDQELDEFLMDTRGEYEFKDLDDWEGFSDQEEDELLTFTGPRRRPSPNTLATLAARTALKWGSRATTTSVLRRMGYRLGSRRSGRVFAEPLEEALLGEPEMLPFDPAAGVTEIEACSAALLEDDELMRTLAEAAAVTKSKAEATGLVAAMVPLSFRFVPDVYRALWPALPALIQGAMGVTRLLRRHPATRRYIGRLLPTMLQNTAAQLARYARRGQAITQRLASQVLARQAAAVLQRRDEVRSTSPRQQKQRSRSRSYGGYLSEDWGGDGHGA